MKKIDITNQFKRDAKKHHLNLFCLDRSITLFVKWH